MAQHDDIDHWGPPDWTVVLDGTRHELYGVVEGPVRWIAERVGDATVGHHRDVHAALDALLPRDRGFAFWGAHDRDVLAAWAARQRDLDPAITIDLDGEPHRLERDGERWVTRPAR